MKIIKTIEKQTVLDLAMQHYGNIEAIGEILELNPELKNDPDTLAEGCNPAESAGRFYIDAALLSGQQVNIDESSDLMKKNIVRNLARPVATYDKYNLQPTVPSGNEEIEKENNNPVTTNDHGKIN